MAENAKHNYDESKIKTLSSLEHIRLRTGMYIGRIGNGSNPDDGCYILMKEVLDNAVDEFIMGHGKEVQIHVEGNRVSVRDFGRGIPLGKVVDCVSKSKYQEVGATQQRLAASVFMGFFAMHFGVAAGSR